MSEPQTVSKDGRHDTWSAPWWLAVVRAINPVPSMTGGGQTKTSKTVSVISGCCLHADVCCDHLSDEFGFNLLFDAIKRVMTDSSACCPQRLMELQHDVGHMTTGQRMTGLLTRLVVEQKLDSQDFYHQLRNVCPDLCPRFFSIVSLNLFLLMNQSKNSWILPTSCRISNV